MAEPRGREGHMDWQPEGGKSFDPSSPFAIPAQSGQQHSIFGTPARNQQPLRQVPFGTPSRKQHVPPQSAFAPSLKAQATGTPFRNPSFSSSFTTPQRRTDEAVFSELSGAEDSPAASDYPNDTPEADRMGDINMSGTGGPLVPRRVDKASRYNRSPVRKHTAGRGEIRRHRDHSAIDPIRKRKRLNHDRDVGSIVRHRSQDWEEDSEADSDDQSQWLNLHSNMRLAKGPQKQSNWLGSFFTYINNNPNLPNIVHGWIKTLIFLVLAMVAMYFTWAIAAAVRSDVHDANDAARHEIIGQMMTCRSEYIANGCSTTVAPALKEMCSRWQDCMNQNPESIRRVKVSAGQMAEIFNEFVESMNYKAWAFFLVVLLVVLIGNSLTFAKHSTPYVPPPVSRQPPDHVAMMSGVDWPLSLQTPRRNMRHVLIEEDTDTDSSPPIYQNMLPAPSTPSTRRSPSKGHRTGSPVKYARTPSRGY